MGSSYTIATGLSNHCQGAPDTYSYCSWITGYSEVMPGWREGISIRFCPIGVRHCPKTRFATSFSAIGTMSLGPNRTQLPILKLGRRPNFAKLEDCGARDREYFNEFNG
jgi:hypothetical protein